MRRPGDTITARGLSVEIGQARLLNELSFALPAGELTVILGPNGAGKTTLLRALGGLDAPTSGAVLWSDQPWSGLSTMERALRVAHIGQEAPPPFPWTVFELVLMGRAPHLGLRGLEREEDRARASACLEAVELSALKNRQVEGLSAGEMQRVSWARALCQDTPTLLLDEPVSHQDPRHALALMELLRGLVVQGSTVVAVLHDVSLALRYADHVLLLRQGQMVHSGPAHGLTPELLSEVYGTPCRREGDSVRFEPPSDDPGRPS